MSSRADFHEDSGIPRHVSDRLSSMLGGWTIDAVEGARSAQQRVWIVHLRCRSDVDDGTAPDSGELYKRTSQTADGAWREALERGRGHIVVRMWKGGSRWWNLHQNRDVACLAKAEIDGYRQARKALRGTDVVHSGDPKENWKIPRLPVVPEVLCFFPADVDDGQDRPPWAVLEYVGPKSGYFLPDREFAWDEYWQRGMVRTRVEFGFDEPHPRWGRVPESEALQYALQVLRAVVVPLHRHTKRQYDESHQRDRHGMSPAIRYDDMVALYRRTLDETLHPRTTKRQVADDLVTDYISRLDTAVRRLEANSRTVADIGCVLVHMDLQPQNLMHGRYTNRDVCGSDNPQQQQQQQQLETQIHSVLDWEEAAWADPRFELLLLGRKVCANQRQAEKLWDAYQVEALDTDNATDALLELGPIQPWLQLECVHSITTLLLQSLALLNGGRNPWETKSDLVGKLQREFHRLGVFSTS